MKLKTKVRAKAIDMSNKYSISKFAKDSEKTSVFARDYEGTNYRYSDNPFPTYIFEPDLLALEQRGNKDIEMYIEDIIEKTQLLIDDANDDLKDIANRLASKFEVKRNSAELDLARDLYTIALKDGYNSGFSMILEFDDLFIDGITPQQREYLENNLRSNAEMMMKNIAKKNGFVLANKSQDKYIEDDDIIALYESKEQEVDEEGAMAHVQLKKIIKNAQELINMLSKDTQLPAWIQSKLTLADHNLEASADYLLYEDEEYEDEMFVEDAKAHDKSDIQKNIEIDESLAKQLVNENLKFEDDNIVFKIEGKDFRISHSHPISEYISDIAEYDGDMDELYSRISSGDLKEDIEKEMIGHTAFLEIWI